MFVFYYIIIINYKCDPGQLSLMSSSFTLAGFKLLFSDIKEVRRIKTKMYSGGVEFRNLPYREMEKLRQVGVH